MYSSKKKGDGQYAVTHYKVMQENKMFSLVDVNIDTGRKNQIRVHFGDMGHFIIGDDKYGEPSNPIKRLGLHAYELDIINPLNRKLMKFKAPMPKEFTTLMNENYVKCSKENKKK
jgi:23S rRNA-/tRNA-specific pseudouridylate synthase